MVRPGRTDVLRSSRLERAIGVVYRPATERDSHYFRARVGDQFDAVIHVDETRAWSRSSGPRAGRPGSSRRPIRSPC
jgi:erythromycin esterase-like protein